jgi:hypothetical protein
MDIPGFPHRLWKQLTWTQDVKKKYSLKNIVAVA